MPDNPQPRAADRVRTNLDPTLAAEISRDVVSRESLLRRVEELEMGLRMAIENLEGGYPATAWLLLRIALGGGKEVGGGRSS